MSNQLITEQPQPIKNNLPAVWDLVVDDLNHITGVSANQVLRLVEQDMKDRDSEGLKRYGTRLQPCNGRNALTDAYQEALDLVVYLRQAIYEKENTTKNSATTLWLIYKEQLRLITMFRGIMKSEGL